MYFNVLCCLLQELKRTKRGVVQLNAPASQSPRAHSLDKERDGPSHAMIQDHITADQVQGQHP